MSNIFIDANGVRFAATITPGPYVGIDANGARFTFDTAAGAGDVTLAGDNVFTGNNTFNGHPVVIQNITLDPAALSGYLTLTNSTANAVAGFRAVSAGSTAGNGANNILQRARGTTASPTAVNSGDRLGGFSFGGYDGSAYQTGAFVISSTTEAYTGSARGANIAIGVAKATTTSLATVLTITHDNTNPTFTYASNPLFKQSGIWTFADASAVVQATINNATGAVNPTDLTRLSDVQAGDAAAEAAAIAACSSTIATFNPSSGDTILTVSSKNAGGYNVIATGGTLMTLTIQLPAAPAADGDRVNVCGSTTVTTLSIDGNGASVLSPPATLTPGTPFSYFFSTATNSWIRV